MIRSESWSRTATDARHGHVDENENRFAEGEVAAVEPYYRRMVGEGTSYAAAFARAPVNGRVGCVPGEQAALVVDQPVSHKEAVREVSFA